MEIKHVVLQKNQEEHAHTHKQVRSNVKIKIKIKNQQGRLICFVVTGRW